MPPRRRRLVAELAAKRPDIPDPERVIARGWVEVDGVVTTNPSSLVSTEASIVVRVPKPLRGEVKLQAALAAFDVPVTGRVALDAGAAAGGFTRALLKAGAARVYAVEAGFGQLLGSLRQDPRVVNLERTNLSQLDPSRVPEPIELVALDLSYIPLTTALAELERIEIAPGADLVALVKPMFELGLPRAPRDEDSLERAVGKVGTAAQESGWRAARHVRSPVPGARGAVEALLHARRR